jgi:hypothetical protein
MECAAPALEERYVNVIVYTLRNARVIAAQTEGLNLAAQFGEPVIQCPPRLGEAMNIGNTLCRTHDDVRRANQIQ